MSERMFPVLFSGASERKAAVALGCPLAVPWSLLAPYEPQALANHDQSLQRLAERGGLSPDEMVAVLEGRKWRQMVLTQSIPALLARFKGAALAAAAPELLEMLRQWVDLHGTETSQLASDTRALLARLDSDTSGGREQP